MYMSVIFYTYTGLTKSCSLQDCLATIPPHPFYIGERDDEYDVAESLFDQDSMWFVRPQLFFHCRLRPIGTAADRFNRSDEDIQLDLVFFSPFEELRLRTAGRMESKGIHRVYDPSPVPTLYVRRVDYLLGRVPFIPCFLDENET
jgi:hypothetical protein